MRTLCRAGSKAQTKGFVWEQVITVEKRLVKNRETFDRFSFIITLKKLRKVRDICAAFNENTS